MPRSYSALPTSADLPAFEHEVLRRWHEAKIFERSLEQTASGPPWIFYEGPPTANGMPGVHHIGARVLKDALPRFKTMQGFHVPRRAGWDCHGLPVEVAVEKELGLSSKRDIESYGITAFNARCRESVLRHVDAFAEFTRRMGYWIDLSQAYRTMAAPSVVVRFPLRTLPPTAPPQLAGADLLVWTTTPWTLVSNTAVAVHPEATYVVAERSRDGNRVVVAADLSGRVLDHDWRVLARFPGQAMVGARYHAPFGIIRI